MVGCSAAVAAGGVAAVAEEVGKSRLMGLEKVVEGRIAVAVAAAVGEVVQSAVAVAVAAGAGAVAGADLQSI